MTILLWGLVALAWSAVVFGAGYVIGLEHGEAVSDTCHAIRARLTDGDDTKGGEP